MRQLSSEESPSVNSIEPTMSSTAAAAATPTSNSKKCGCIISTCTDRHCCETIYLPARDRCSRHGEMPEGTEHGCCGAYTCATHECVCPCKCANSCKCVVSRCVGRKCGVPIYIPFEDGLLRAPSCAAHRFMQRGVRNVYCCGSDTCDNNKCECTCDQAASDARGTPQAAEKKAAERYTAPCGCLVLRCEDRRSCLRAIYVPPAGRSFCSKHEITPLGLHARCCDSFICDNDECRCFCERCHCDEDVCAHCGAEIYVPVAMDSECDQHGVRLQASSFACKHCVKLTCGCGQRCPDRSHGLKEKVKTRPVRCAYVPVEKMQSTITSEPPKTRSYIEHACAYCHTINKVAVTKDNVKSEPVSEKQAPTTSPVATAAAADAAAAADEVSSSSSPPSRKRKTRTRYGAPSSKRTKKAKAKRAAAV